jgi:uncharacterized protein YndB with AHSA1/START domain
MTGTIETDAFLPHPPEQVWQALTTRDLLARWLMPNDFEPRVGHRFTFHTDPVPDQGFDGKVHCEVLELAPPERLKISWRSGALDTTVTWQLAKEGTGTRLFLTHTGFDDTDPAQIATQRLLGGGWQGHLLKRLQQALNTES